MNSEQLPRHNDGTRPIADRNTEVDAPNTRPVGTTADSARAFRALAIGALAFGALAVGALAIGRLAIGRVTIGRSRIRRLEIEELDVKRLRVKELKVDNGPMTRDDDTPLTGEGLMCGPKAPLGSPPTTSGPSPT